MVSKIVSDQEIGIIIPAYNADPALFQELIERLQKISYLHSIRILIVDDGSEQPVRIPGNSSLDIKLSRHEKNLGKGAALKTGFQYFFADHGLDRVITMDADLQHPPEKIPEFIQAQQQGQGGIIMGYRKRRPTVMPFARILSNTLTSLIISALTGQLVRDSQCGFRLLEKSAVDHIILKEVGFHLESELLILAGRNGIQFGFVEIPTLYQQEKSSINNVSDTLNFIHLILRILKERIFNNV